MSSKIRLAVIGFAHMHITTMVDSFNALPDRFEWIGCADIPPKTEPISSEGGTRKRNIETVLKKTGMTLSPEWHDVIAMKPDLAIVTCENTWHKWVCEEILSAGIHVILEKPMALSLADAQSMVACAHAHGVKLIVNWPTSWYAPFRTAHRVMEEGIIGRVIKFHYRNPESLGPYSYGQHMTQEEMKAEWWYQADMGGGAMADYLGYGCGLSRWFIGKKPLSAFCVKESFFTKFSDVEDHAALTILYPDTLALIEGTWAVFAGGMIPGGPILFGEKGTIVCDRRGDAVKIYLERHQTEPSLVLEADPLPEDRSTLALETLHFLKTGELHATLDEVNNLDAVAAVDAAYRSVKSGKLELC